MIDGSARIGGIKINNFSGNASINTNDATFTSSSVTIKAQGKAVTIGEFTSVWAQMQNTWFDSDVSDQNSGNSPASSSPIQ